MHRRKPANFFGIQNGPELSELNNFNTLKLNKNEITVILSHHEIH